jgi:RNA polymerase sigma-70 factor (ECF subfamily)
VGLGSADDPAAVVTSRESVRLALVAALQHLPPRQRAVLLLRDVLQWHAAEVAAALDTSTTAVNSLLQRARAELQRAGLSEEDVAEPSEPDKRALLDRYMQVLEDKDIAGLVELFTSDARWEMPPFTGWYQGPDDIGKLVDTQCPAGPGGLRLVPTAANGQNAFGMYLVGDDGDFHPFQLHVLDLRGAAVSHVTAFFDLSLFRSFGLPDVLPGESARASDDAS